jgi:hypothetical protein
LKHVLAQLDRQAREIGWDLYLLEQFSLQNTKRYKELEKRLRETIETAQKLRGQPITGKPTEEHDW